MKSDELREKIANITVWASGEKRAPHKPLLLLYALGRADRDEPRLFLYAEAKDKLRQLLEEFGPYRRTHHPSYPFVRLSNDGIWQLTGRKELDTKRDWSDRDLLHNNISGGFTEEIFAVLKKNKQLVYELSRMILEQHFPESIHEDILREVGLDFEPGKKRRDPEFRERILRAYEYSCAVCGFNVRLGNTLVALEAAHIKWRQAGGPDNEVNGIALCTMHHKLFDRGVFSLDRSLKLQVASSAHGTEGFKEWLLRFHGKEIRPPQSLLYMPNNNFVHWHAKEVFRGPARYLGIK